MIMKSRLLTLICGLLSAIAVVLSATADESGVGYGTAVDQDDDSVVVEGKKPLSSCCRCYCCCYYCGLRCNSWRPPIQVETCYVRLFFMVVNWTCVPWEEEEEVVAVHWHNYSAHRCLGVLVDVYGLNRLDNCTGAGGCYDEFI